LKEHDMSTTVTRERLISADAHVQVAHDQVKAHLLRKYHPAYDDALAAFAASMKGWGAARANQAMMAEYSHPAMGRPGASNPVDRLADMDIDGVEAEVLFSEVSGFRYLYLLKEGGPAATRAFNMALAEFASADPTRLVVSYQIPIHDIDFAVEEVQRVASEGGKSLQIPVFPAELGLPDYWNERYDPLWATIQETQLPICCHIGLNTALDDLAYRDPTPQNGITVPVIAMSTAEAMGMWIMGGVLARFSDLKLVFVEPGLGWVAWWLFIVDDLMQRQGYKFPAISELPSTYYYRNIHLTFIDEPDALHRLRDRLGVRNILWSNDYPHPVSSWPNSRALVEQHFEGIPADERQLIVSGNAQRVWNLK
jgi:predicted TIM-barrel fold metal-dependent hydrolase